MEICPSLLLEEDTSVPQNSESVDNGTSRGRKRGGGKRSGLYDPWIKKRRGTRKPQKNSKTTFATTDVDGEWEVEKIVDHVKSDDGYHYLVKWVGYIDPSWNEEINMTGCATMMRKYWTAYRERGGEEDHPTFSHEETAAEDSGCSPTDVHAVLVDAARSEKNSSDNTEIGMKDGVEAFSPGIDLAEVNVDGTSDSGVDSVDYGQNDSSSAGGNHEGVQVTRVFDVAFTAPGMEGLYQECSLDSLESPDSSDAVGKNLMTHNTAATDKNSGDTAEKFGSPDREIADIRSEGTGHYAVVFVGDAVPRVVSVEESKQGKYLDAFLKFYECRLQPASDGFSGYNT